MDKFLIHGPSRLEGTVTVSGSKNSSLPILAATILSREKCVLHNVPNLSDTRFMLEILRHLGAEVVFENGTVTVHAQNISSTTPYDLVRKMRASICVMGPILARNREVTISMPGGCVIGDRPIDIHLRGIEALGAVVTTSEGNVHAVARELVGREINMGGKFGSTVLGTGNVMMAATLARGVTIIEEAACEPEVVDLASFLNKMGARVSGAGTRRIEVVGVESLHGATHDIIPDRIEAGTFIVAAAATKGRVTVRGVEVSHQRALFDQLQKAGVCLELDGTSVHVSVPNGLKSVDITTQTFPGFPTDMQAQMCAMLSRAQGLSVITEKIYPNRFMHVSELKRLGADIRLEGPSAIIRGVGTLKGAPIMASDLRASAALVIAGFMAEGRTEVLRVYHIDRGYENIDSKFAALGVKIERLKE
ncbi:MAG: UDP-N-acetylglucosamine 1-carboxyvinyltransferase [Verrucomicrobiae bacterium]|nr:UDP-N-acetylglucosamine 1-carboxyvinyltransferase [Verrucomicrobiae bacterium]